MVNTAAKGRRFEYAVKRVLLNSGYVVVRCAASKPWDLVAANNRVVYAVECKSGQMSVQQARNEYNNLKEKTMLLWRQKDGSVAKVPSVFVPIVFFVDKLKRLAMYTRAEFLALGGNRWRPYFDGEVMKEVLTHGQEDERNSNEGTEAPREELSTEET
ncbi:MAG: hypothetical protein ACYTFW_12570 [Planctomycetota bacterium]|jgi:Holliday junction resolvase-like predicted endonuclease